MEAEQPYRLRTSPGGSNILAHPGDGRTDAPKEEGLDPAGLKPLDHVGQHFAHDKEIFDKYDSDNGTRSEEYYEDISSDEELTDEGSSDYGSVYEDEDYAEADPPSEVASSQNDSDLKHTESKRQHWTLVQHLGRSRWFKRGWTLQELLAPQNVVFYDRCWKELGTKRSLRDEISQLTRIEHEDIAKPRSASIAAKMSWAADRRTTREEDLSYCLMGLFEVNMPLLYGEGSSAFQRLQHEIIDQSSDESIFAWEPCEPSDSGMFARSPKYFAGCGDIIATNLKCLQRPPYNKTNKGLAIDVLVNPGIFDNSPSNSLLVYLNCVRRAKKDMLVGISLTKERQGSFKRRNMPQRGCRKFYDVNDSSTSSLEFRKIHVRTFFDDIFQRSFYVRFGIVVRPSPSFRKTFSLIHTSHLNEGSCTNSMWGVEPLELHKDRPDTWKFESFFPYGISALMFQGLNKSERFALMLATTHKSLGIHSLDMNILSYAANTSMQKLEDYVSIICRTQSLDQDSDRLSKCLQCNTRVTASLRRYRGDGFLRDYYVDLDIA